MRNYSALMFLILIFSALFLQQSCATGGAMQAEEYFSIAMAYYEIGQTNTSNRAYYFSEAEKWFNRARAADKTMAASEYNLGRIAFETGRYEEGAIHFEGILSRDPENVMAMKGAAYSRIKNGDLEKAEAHYGRILELIPESSDDGFNYALVLYSLKKYENCEEVLSRYPYALEENPSSLLLLARAQKAQDKVEAIDSYAKWAISAGSTNPQGLYEYAQALENAGLYARAIEQYQEAIDAVTQDTEELKKSAIRFDMARLILTEDPENDQGIGELETSVSEGFSDTGALEELLGDERISEGNKNEIERIMNNILNAGTEEPEPEEEEGGPEEELQDEDDTNQYSGDMFEF